MPKPDFQGYRNRMKKSYEQEQYPSGIDEHLNLEDEVFK
jgi:hypothetical protein